MGPWWPRSPRPFSCAGPRPVALPHARRRCGRDGRAAYGGGVCRSPAAELAYRCPGEGAAVARSAPAANEPVATCTLVWMAPSNRATLAGSARSSLHACHVGLKSSTIATGRSAPGATRVAAGSTVTRTASSDDRTGPESNAPPWGPAAARRGLNGARSPQRAPAAITMRMSGFAAMSQNPMDRAIRAQDCGMPPKWLQFPIRSRVASSLSAPTTRPHDARQQISSAHAPHGVPHEPRMTRSCVILARAVGAAVPEALMG